MSDLFEALRLFITNTGSRSQLDVGGELDVSTASLFGDHLALLVDAGTGDVDVDMALVTFCDAATLRVLVTAHGRLSTQDRRLRIINGSRAVVRLLQLTGLDTMLLDLPMKQTRRPTAVVGDRHCLDRSARPRLPRPNTHA